MIRHHKQTEPSISEHENTTSQQKRDVKLKSLKINRKSLLLLYQALKVGNGEVKERGTTEDRGRSLQKQRKKAVPGWKAE